VRRVVAVVVAAGLVAGVATVAGAAPVRIGSKSFTESVILGDIAAALVAAEGVVVEHRRQIGGTRILWEALLRGDIDVYPEYTGTLIQEVLAGEPIESLADLERALGRHGVAMTAPLGFDNTYAISVKRDLAERLGLVAISDLRAHPDLVLGFSSEFMDRGDGWPALRERYGLRHQRVTGLDHDLAYRGLVGGSIDVIDAYSTDGEIAQYDLVVLADDLRHFTSYQALLLYRQDLQAREAAAVRALERLEGAISADEMTRLNKAAKVDGVAEPVVAAAFVQRAFGEVTAVATVGRAERIARRTLEHLVLVVVALVLGFAVAFPAGILAARRPRLGQVVLGMTGVVQTIPSLALLAIMVPLLGIGTVPAIVALFLYSLLPMARNTATGLASIPAALRESAEVLGLDAGVRLWRIELPLAARTILAGVKTSAVITVGYATLGALIGAGGYGQPILTGIRLADMSLILEGAVPAAAMALVVQALFEVVEPLVVPRGLRLGDRGTV